MCKQIGICREVVEIYNARVAEAFGRDTSKSYFDCSAIRYRAPREGRTFCLESQLRERRTERCFSRAGQPVLAYQEGQSPLYHRFMRTDKFTASVI